MNNKLFSTIYILGTAIAIAFTMVIAEIYYVKVADIAPEVNRSRTYTVNFAASLQNKNEVTMIGHWLQHELTTSMQTPDCATAVAQLYNPENYYIRQRDGLRDRRVNAIITDPAFFRFYQFRFVNGAPFTEDDMDSRRCVAVVTEDLARQQGLEQGGTLVLNNREYRICGIVETPSVLTENCCADIYLPYMAEGVFVVNGVAFTYENVPFAVRFAVAEDKREAFFEELKEVQARYNSVNTDTPIDLQSSVISHYSSVWQGLTAVFLADNSHSLWWYVALSIMLLLLVPALNLSGMVAARMQRRLPEMAVRKAFGAKRRTLLSQVIKENLRLTLIGGAVGLFLAWMAIYAWRDWVFDLFATRNGIYATVPVLKGEMLFAPAIFLTALLVCLLLNLLAAALPAWLSLRQPIVKGMMKEEQGEGGGWRSKVWLAAELTLVTVVCWWTFDPVIVNTFITHMPLGYDAEKVVQLQIASSYRHQESDHQIYSYDDEIRHLLEKVKECEEVERAYVADGVAPVFYTPTVAREYCVDGDTLTAFHYSFRPGSPLFEIFGIQSLTPGVSTSGLSQGCEYDRDIIVTRSFATALFGTTDVAGRQVQSYFWDWDDGQQQHWQPYRIRAVVEDVRADAFDRNRSMVFRCTTEGTTTPPIILRLRNGVNASRFIEERGEELMRGLVTEHLYIRQMQPGRQALEQRTERIGVNGHNRRNLLIAAFFAVNLAFGVFGSLLMYTQQRREEAGVRRAFGATRRSVFLGFLREAWLLTSVSVILGCTIYFQIAASKGLFTGELVTDGPKDLWFDSFGTHFLIVSACVYLIILGTVLIGTAIPAWRISRSEITEALKDE